MEKRILLVITFSPSRQWNGIMLRFYQTCIFLSHLGKVDIFSYSKLDMSTLNALDLDCNHFFILNQNNFINRIKGFIYSILKIGSTKRFSTPKSRRLLKEIVNNYDLIFCFFGQSAIDILDLNINIPIYIDMVDTISYHYKIAKNIHPFRQFFYKIDLPQMISYERHIVNKANQVFITTLEEKKQLLKLLPEISSKESKIKVIPNISQPVSREYYRSHELRKKIGFIGSLDYYPNIIALNRLVSQILPKLKREDLEIFVIGDAKQEIQKYCSHPQVKFTGYVENLELVLNKIDLLVFPLDIVSGIQNKLITAFSFGIPCVATPRYLFHEELKDSVHLLIAQTDHDFSIKIQQILNDQVLRDTLSRNSQQFAKKTLSKEKIEQDFLLCFS